MTNTKVFFIVLSLYALVLFGRPLLRGDTRQTDNQTLTSKVVAGYDTKVDEGAVVVTVTPSKLFSSDGQAIFTVTLDTHNVPLDYDLRELSTVTDDKGNVYRASSWTGGRGGHHLTGELTFEDIDIKTKTLTLVILEIEGRERRFQWNADSSRR